MLNKIIKVVASNSMAQLVVILSTPLLAQLYGQEAFGLLGVLASIGAVAITLSMLKLDLILLMDERESVYDGYYTVVLFLSVIIASFLCLGFVIISSKYDLVFIFSLAFYIVGMALFNMRLAILLARSNVNGLGVVTVLRAIFCVILQCVLYYYFEVYGLVIGVAISYIMFIDIHGFIKRNPLESTAEILHYSIKERSDILLYSTATSLVSSASVAVNSISIASMIGLEAAGLYFMSVRLLQTPVMIMSNAIVTVMMSELKTFELLIKNRKKILLVFIILLAIGLVMGSAGLVFGENILLMVLGEEWGEIWVFIVMVFPWFLLQFLNSPLQMVIKVSGFEKFNTGIALVALLLKISIIFLIYSNVFSMDLVSVIALIGVLMNLAIIGLGFYILYGRFHERNIE